MKSSQWRATAARVLQTMLIAGLTLYVDAEPPPPAPLPPPTIVVNTTDQHSGGCTLSAAIMAANLNSGFDGCPAGQGDDIIFVPAGTYSLIGTGYTDPNWGDSALPGVTTSAGNQLEIRGAGANLTTIVRPPSGAGLRFFLVFGDLTLRGLNMEGGQTAGDGGVALLLRGPSSVGGGLRAISSRFAHNSARSGGVVAGSGNYDRSWFESIDSAFTANRAVGSDNDARGGVYNGNCLGSAVVTTSRFDGNEARAGGAIYSESCSNRTPSIEVTDSTFVDNTAGFGSTAGFGGAIAFFGTGEITRTRFLHNRAGSQGGAIDGLNGTITDSTFADNTAGTSGGAIDTGNGVLNVFGSTFARNTAVFRGGAIHFDGPSATVTNSTFSANRALDHGGALWILAGSPLRINSITLTGTVSPSAVYQEGSATVEIANSVVAGNAGIDWYLANGSVTSFGHNLIGNAEGGGVPWDGPGDLAGKSENPLDAKLGPLAPNGGPTETHMPMAGSPLVDAGDSSAPGADFPGCEALDQRRVARPGSGTSWCDIGAIERVVTADPVLSIGKTAMTPFGYVGQPLTYRITVVNTGGGLATGVVITDHPAQMTPDGAIPSQGFCVVTSGTVTCELGAIEPDAMATIDVIVAATSTGVLRNTATVTAEFGVPAGGVSASGDVIAREPIRVNTTQQSSTLPGDCTLGDAIRAANTDRAVNGCAAGHGRDLILLPAGTYPMALAQLKDPIDGPAALPKVESLIEIRGDGVDQTVIERGPGASEMRFFQIVNSAELTLRGLRVRGGHPDPAFNRDGGAVISGTLIADTVVFEQNTTTGNGGVFARGVLTRGFLRAVNSRFEHNSAQQNGGVAFEVGFDVAGSTFSDNSAEMGGVYQGNCSAIAAAGSTFRANSARLGGAIDIEKCSTTFKTLTLTDSMFADNIATQSGGAIVAGAISTIVRTRFLRNRAGSHYGGALEGVQGTILDSTFSDNVAGSAGGAINSGSGELVVRGSTFARNAARTGGALMLNDTSATVANSTFSANAATDNGGAILIGAGFPRAIRFNNLTITGTLSPSAIYGGWGADAEVEVANSIVAGNAGDGWYHSHGKVTSLGHNLIGNGDGGNVDWKTDEDKENDQVGTTAAPIDARLGPLQDNGGPTETHALLDGSPAADHGDPGAPGSDGATCEAKDQRGVVRPGSGTTRCDVGAFESEVDRPPQIVDRGNQLSDEGTTIDLAIDATDPEGHLLTYSVDALYPLPPGLAFEADGHIRGFLGYQSAGNYPVAIQANDGFYTSRVEFWWTVRNLPCNPIAQNDAVTTLVNTEVEIFALANDVSPAACGPIGFTLSDFTPPDHGALTYDSKLRTFSYSPAMDFAGVDSFTYTITNTDGGSATATVTVTVQSPLQCVAPPSGLVAWWPGEGNATDIQGGHNGTPQGGVTFAAGEVRQAFSFDGIDGRVDVPDQPTLNPGTNSFTVDAWLFKRQLQQTQAIAPVVAKHAGDFANGYVLTAGTGGAGSPTTNEITAAVGDGSGHEVVLGTGVDMPLDVWVHLAMTFDGSTKTLRVYKDGALIGSGSNPLVGSVDPSGQGLRIGSYNRTSLGRIETFPGLIDEVGLYDRPLTAQEIQAIVVAGQFGKCVPNRPPAAVDDVVHTDIDTSVTIAVLANDSDPDGDMLAVESVGAATYGVAAILADGSILYTPPSGPIGSDSFTYTLTDGRGGTDTGTVVVAVGPVATTTTLAASPGLSIFGETVTLTATVARSIPLPNAMGGTVTFKDGATVLDTVDVVAGSASFATSSLAVGSHDIVAEFSGEPRFMPSQSAIAVVSVAPLTVTIAITERVSVDETIMPRPSAMLTIVETVAVAESITPGVIAPAVISIIEGVAVQEVLTPRPSAMLTVVETVAVAESITPGVIAPARITIIEGVAVQESLVPRPSAMLTVRETVAVDDGFVTGNTPPGTNVTVRPIDPATGGTPVTVTFSSVTQAGVTAVTTSSVGPAIPAGFAIGTPSLYFDITTTASYTPPITVCIDYSGMKFRNPSALQLFHFEGGVWVNHTLSLNLATTTACAVVDSLSPFAIFEPANQPPVANAGPDQVIEATSPSGAAATLNGSASSDPDDDPLAYTWTGPFGTRSGATANVTLPLGTNVITLTVDDGNGGTSNDAVVVTVRDTIAPGVTIIRPVATTYLFNQVIVASYACSDGGSGIATCAGPVPSGSPIDTSTERQHAFVVAATDAAGNTTTRTIAYTVTGLEGRMSGAGEIEAPHGHEHRFGFHIAERHVGVERGELHYTRTTPKSGKPKEKIDRFESTSVETITFWNDPAFRPGWGPKPAVDSAVFSGTGRWNGTPGYTFEARASDEGEPGRWRDTFAITIRDRRGTVVATGSGTLREGNIQSEGLIRR